MAEPSLDIHSDLIKQVGLGVNIARTYPKGHPSLLPVVQRLKVLLKEIPIEEESISFVIIEDVIMIKENRFDSKRLPIVKSLVERFNQVGVKSITFNVDVSDDDLREFFAAMAATPADIADYGDIVALTKSLGIAGVKVNRYRVGVISTDSEVKEIKWENFLESLVIAGSDMTDEQKVKELGGFLASVGVAGSEAAEVQTTKIIAGLEKMALMTADRYGEERWDEYSLVFSRMLAALSPTIKKNIGKYKTENKKLAVLFRSLIPTIPDEEIIDLIATKAKQKAPDTEEEVVGILQNIPGARLPNILSTLRVNVPDLNFEQIAARLMKELEKTKGTREAGKFQSKNLEADMRQFFPRLRDSSHEERNKTIDELIEFSDRLFEAKNYDLIRLLIDRFDTMADAETEMRTFSKVVEGFKKFYLKASELEKNDIVRFVSKKFGKHLVRKGKAYLEKKRVIIKAISDLKDQDYVPELVSLLWDPGSFAEARQALVSLSDFSIPVLIGTLKETEDRSVRMKILDVLSRVGAQAVPELRKLLSSPEWYVRRNGVYLLGEIKATSAVHDIGKLIDDDKEQIQFEVVKSLNKIGDLKCKVYLKKALNSEYLRVVVAAMTGLEKEDVQLKIAEVAAWLKHRKSIPDEGEEAFRCKIITILGNVGDDSVVDALVEVLNEKALFKGELLSITKKTTLNALAKIGCEKAMQALQDVTKHRDQFVAAAAKEILEKVKKDDGVRS